MLDRGGARRRLVVIAIAAAAALGATACGGARDGDGDGDDGASRGTTSEAVGLETVQDVVNGTCSTAPMVGLVRQIVAEVNCIQPNAYAELPQRSNVTRGAATFAFLETPARDALVKAIDAHPNMQLGLNSMLRVVAEQYVLYTWYLQRRCGIQLAAVPGTSNHETGLAFDTSDYVQWRPILESGGAFRWFGSADVVHFDYVGPGAKDLRGRDILAFQKLWNENHPNDKIAEDGSYGQDTAARIKGAPIGGFPLGAECTPDGGMPDPDAGGADPPPAADAPPAADTDAGSATPAAEDDGALPPLKGAGCAVAPAERSSTRTAASAAALAALVLAAAQLRRRRRRRTR